MLKQLATTAIIDNNTYDRHVTSVPENENETFDRKLDLVTEGLLPQYKNTLLKLPYELRLDIVNYLLAMKTEKNLSLHYSRIIIKSLAQLATLIKKKAWKAYSRDDILAFLDSRRRPDVSDQLHKWIGTYNLYRTICMGFFKWLYYSQSPDIEPARRPKPACMQNIPKLKRKETSIYKADDLWTQQDDLLFLKYCPSTRDKCYHSISRDLSCRPNVYDTAV